MPFDKLKAMFGINPQDEEFERQKAQYESNSDQLKSDADKILDDRLKMQINAEQQGPRLGIMTTLPAEKAQGEQIAGAVGSSIGSIGNINKARGISSAFKNKEAYTKYLENLAGMSGGAVQEGRAAKAALELGEQAVKPVTHTPEKVSTLRSLYDKILKAEDIAPEKKQEIFKKLQREEFLTKQRGYKLPE